MQINVTDSQAIGETQATIFTCVQQSLIPTAVFLTNSGSNTINYDFQQHNGTSWVDIGAVGSSFNGALIAGQSVAVLVQSSYTQIQLIGNASGGSVLSFSVSRLASRAPGGPLPILTV